MVRAHRISAESSFLGQNCALCKQAFDVGDAIVICPEDGSRHHDHCWQANGNRCTAYGCTGQGEIGVSVGSSRRRQPPSPTQPTIIPNPAATGRAPSSPPGSKVRVFPARNFGCARSCFFLGAVLFVLLMGAACFGLYTLADDLLRDAVQWAPGLLPAAQTVPPALLSLLL